MTGKRLNFQHYLPAVAAPKERFCDQAGGPERFPALSASVCPTGLASALKCAMSKLSPANNFWPDSRWQCQQTEYL